MSVRLNFNNTVYYIFLTKAIVIGQVCSRHISSQQSHESRLFPGLFIVLTVWWRQQWIETSYLCLIPTASHRRQQNPTTTAQIRAMLRIILLMQMCKKDPGPQQEIFSQCLLIYDSLWKESAWAGCVVCVVSGLWAASGSFLYQLPPALGWTQWTDMMSRLDVTTDDNNLFSTVCAGPHTQYTMYF